MMQLTRIEPVLQIGDVAEIFRVSIPTVKRWVHDARAGKNNFILPISTPGRQLAWNKNAVERYLSENQQAVNAPKAESSAKTAKRHNEAMREIERKHGIKVKQQVGKEGQ